MWTILLSSGVALHFGTEFCHLWGLYKHQRPAKPQHSQRLYYPAELCCRSSFWYRNLPLLRPPETLKSNLSPAQTKCGLSYWALVYVFILVQKFATFKASRSIQAQLIHSLAQVWTILLCSAVALLFSTEICHPWGLQKHPRPAKPQHSPSVNYPANLCCNSSFWYRNLPLLRPQEAYETSSAPAQPKWGLSF